MIACVKKERPTMRPKTYPIFARAVSEGIALGWQRAHKHTENPTEDQIKDSIEQNVLNEVCEVFDFDRGDE